MFSLKKKKTRGVRTGHTEQPVHEILSDGDEPIEWLEQHHRKTMNNKSQTQFNFRRNIPTNSVNTSYNPNSFSQALYSSSGLDYPMSGDESDSNNHSQIEHLRSQFYTPDPKKRTKEYHLEQATQAIELLKTATRPDGWKKVDKHKTGCVVYQAISPATLPSHGDSKYPAFKGEHIIRGFKAQDVFSIVSVRKLWDDWYDEVSCVESLDDSTSLVYMLMKGSISSKPRDVAIIERKVVEKDGTIYFASCSVESDKIPLVPGKVRAEVFLAGWIIQPLPSNPPISKITYVIHTDLLGRLPKFIAKRPLAKRAMVITAIETYLKKNGTPGMATGPPKKHRRSRSLSEPLKPDQFPHMPQDSEDEEPGTIEFLGSLQPMKGRHDSRYMDDSALESADDEPSPRRDPKPRATKAPSSFFTDSTLYSEEIADVDEPMPPAPVKAAMLDILKKKQDDIPASLRTPQTIVKPQPPERSPERVQEKVPEKTRTPANRSQVFSEPDTRKAPTSKRVSVPVVAPKSEARTKSYNNNSSHQLAVPGSSTQLVTPNTPPLTPPPSIADKDGMSDSDAGTVTEIVKVVPRSPKKTAESGETSRPSTMIVTSAPMKSPSAMMEARRHSSLLNGATPFIPRHSNAVPIRGNPNVSLQSLTRPSGPNSTISTTVKRHSTAPSLDSNRSYMTYTPIMVLPHRHSETARKALAMFKVLASSPEDRWRAISSESGFKCYSRIISGAGLPMLRGEGTISGGWTVEQINSVIESAGCRSTWDERFENMSIAETFNHNEYLFHVTLKSVGSLTGRDLAGVTIIDRDPLTSALYNVSTSVLDSTIPEDPGRVRAMLELSGWSLRPTFDGQGNTVSVNVTYVIQLDIRGNLPSSVVKSITTAMSSTVPRLNQFINKSGYPPFASHISGTRLLDTFDPTSGFYELCYKATPGWTEVRIGRKVYKEGYDFFIKPDDPSVKVEMAPDFGGVRVWTTLDHEGQSIIAQVSRKGQNVPEPEEKKIEEIKEIKEEEEEEVLVSAGNRKRSASSSTESTPKRPESQVSVASKSSQTSRRGRSSRALVTIPAGTPPPPLPRRSSSLTRYSIPIAPYVPGADAPPMPANSSAVIASAAEAVSRPVSMAESAASPTLGAFHIPQMPPTPVSPTLKDMKSNLPPTPLDTVMTAILSDNAAENTLTVAAATTEPISAELIEEIGTSMMLGSSPISTPMPSPMGAVFNTQNSSSEEEAQTLNVSPLDSVLVRRNSGGSVNSFRSDDGPTLAKEHIVRIVPGKENHHLALVAEELQSSDYDSDETEFMEAREELSDDEMELALVLTTAAAWPKSGEDLIADLLAHGTQMVHYGYDMLRNTKAVEVKVGIVFLLLVYYAGRLASFIA
ncbi:hypothetical protein B0O80DRAFT_193891 [Mortierella sp. GBAus27b]|nr:hypothetical protein B0O80DRAFT_193891 [Mortierella sp. GBAus27b]